MCKYCFISLKGEEEEKRTYCEEETGSRRVRHCEGKQSRVELEYSGRPGCLGVRRELKEGKGREGKGIE